MYGPLPTPAAPPGRTVPGADGAVPGADGAVPGAAIGAPGGTDGREGPAIPTTELAPTTTSAKERCGGTPLDDADENGDVGARSTA
jgi:hypothetical protein